MHRRVKSHLSDCLRFLAFLLCRKAAKRRSRSLSYVTVSSPTNTQLIRPRSDLVWVFDKQHISTFCCAISSQKALIFSRVGSLLFPLIISFAELADVGFCLSEHLVQHIAVSWITKMLSHPTTGQQILLCLLEIKAVDYVFVREKNQQRARARAKARLLLVM